MEKRVWRLIRVLVMMLWLVGWGMVLTIAGNCEYDSLSLIALVTWVIDMLLMITGGIKD